MARTKIIKVMNLPHPTACWLVSVTIATGLSMTTATAASPERAKEINQSYAFKTRDMTALGSAVNADITLLDSLFGSAAEFDVPRMQAGEEKGWLGIAIKLPPHPPNEPGTDHALQAIEVTRIMPDSGAEQAGMLEGDLIVGLDGAPIEDKGERTLLAIGMAISKKNLGDKLKLRILRGEHILEQEVTILPHPRVASVLKPHPELERKLPGNGQALLLDVLAREGLTDEYLRLIKAFRNETDKVVSPLIRHASGNPFRLQEVNYVMYNPLQLPVVARKITDRLHGSFNDTHHDLAALVQTAMDELDMTSIPARQEKIKPPSDWAEYLGRLVKAIQHANVERTAVLSVLDAGEIDFLYANAPRLLEVAADSVDKKKTAAEQEQAKLIAREDEARTLRFFQLVLKLDIPRLLDASVEVAHALDLDTLATLAAKPGLPASYPRGWVVHKQKNLTLIDTPAGRILLGGTGDNIYSEDAALILDFGGNDKYFNHAGGSTRRYPYSVVIDLSGDDIYSAADDFAQGAGMIGGGYLVDLAGNDRYIAKNFSQGCGILGAGILADMAGRDQYSAITVSQGAGFFGIGLLAEAGGDDRYFGNYFVQGAGDIKGFGAIVEAGGNDNYFAGGLFADFRAPEKSYDSMSQGFGYGLRPWESLVGASGGIGVIAEAEGNDTYVADYFAQGSSYWLALGILDDRKGNDRYIAGRYAQGAGIHLSAGVLIDGEGDDVYLADFGVAQGCGHDYGIGFLLDNGGNDRYVAGTIAQGAGNANGIGVLSDNGGDDEYFLKSLGQGRGNFEPVRDAGSFGLLFDTGGSDVYSLGGKNNHLQYKTQWGILVDTN